jgi:hypothetical protein
MRILLRKGVVLLLFGLASMSPLTAQKKSARAQRILLANTVYFDNQTGSDAVGKSALAKLKKWRKYQIVPDRTHADLIFYLSADPIKGGNIILSGGQTGHIDSHRGVEEDPIPDYNKQSPTRYAYLTVIDATTGDSLWSGKHPWGGLLTGFNSVGNRLIGDLEKQTRK